MRYKMNGRSTWIMMLIALLAFGCESKDDTTGEESPTEYNDCDGKACGEPCHICDPSSPDCEEPGTNTVCDMGGACVIEAEMAACEDADPCGDKECGDNCNPCVSGVSDCTETEEAKVCNASGECVSFFFVTEEDCDPEPFNDCAEKECGDNCTTCEPGVPGCTETEELKVCNAFSECVSFIFVTDEDCNPENPCEGMACGEPCFEVGGGTGSGAGMPAPSYCDSNEECVYWAGIIADLCPAPPFDDCADKACGDLCSLCNPDNDDCELPGGNTYCNAEGVCSVEDEMGECETENPCDGKACGDACNTATESGDAEDPLPLFCNQDGECVEWFEDPDALCPEDPCGAMDAEEGPEPCDGGGIGFKWDGAACVYQGDLCNCIGADCDDLFEDYESCSEAYAECIAPWQPCVYKVCGAVCNPCDPADPDCPVADINTLCNSIGECVEWYDDIADLCEGEPCPDAEKTYLPAAPLPPCTSQDEGKSCDPCAYLSQDYYCWENQEEIFTEEEAVLWCDSPSINNLLETPPTDDFVCDQNGDCILETEFVSPSDVCKGKNCGTSCWPPDADNISMIPPLVVAPAYCDANGKCVEWFEDPALLCYDPCADKDCGDSCSLCGPEDPNCAETAVPKWCNSGGLCSSVMPNDCS